MGEYKMEEMSLLALFEQARKIHLAASESGADQDAVRKGCEALEKCEEMVSKLGLFSANETKDDISTSNLKYFLVPFYLAELTEKIAQDDRVQILKVSQAKLKEFISFCEAMELVPEEELETSTQGGPNSFADRRAKKIARFKRQRAAESKLLEIKERKERRGRSTKASALSTPVDTGEEDVLDDDGEEEREIELPHWTDIVKTATFKELAPYDPDWYYIRAASMARKIYLRGGIGVGAFRRIYGGSKRNGSRPPHFCKSSGSIARHILQQLQTMNIIELDSKGGRRITSSGQRDLDQVAGRIAVAH